MQHKHNLFTFPSVFYILTMQVWLIFTNNIDDEQNFPFVLYTKRFRRLVEYSGNIILIVHIPLNKRDTNTHSYDKQKRHDLNE